MTGDRPPIWRSGFRTAIRASTALISIVARFRSSDRAPQSGAGQEPSRLSTCSALTPLPPVPARATHVHGRTGSTTDAVVPAGTKVAAWRARAKVIRWCSRPNAKLTAVAATLQTLVAVDAERDLIADHSALRRCAEGIRLRRRRGNEHVLYVGLGAYLHRSPERAHALTFQMTADGPNGRRCARVAVGTVGGINGISLTPTRIRRSS